MPCEELDIVWNNIKAEARALADCEPMLASFYHATLLKHENLGSALSYMLANKLASPIMPAIAIREVVEEAYAADPEMIASAACDIQAVRTRDPAVDKYSTPLLYLKGFHALQAYRIGHWLWRQERQALLARLVEQALASQLRAQLLETGELVAEAFQPASGRRAETWRAVFRKRITVVAAALIGWFMLRGGDEAPATIAGVPVTTVATRRRGISPSSGRRSQCRMTPRRPCSSTPRTTPARRRRRPRCRGR